MQPSQKSALQKAIDRIPLEFDRCDVYPYDFHGCENFHGALALGLASLGKKHGFETVFEYEVRDRGDGRRGFVDLVWIDPDGKPRAAIELDNSNNKKSLRKLMTVPAEARIWICWRAGRFYVDLPHAITAIFRERRYA